MKRITAVSMMMLSTTSALATAQEKPRVAVFSMEFATVKSDADAAFGTSVDVGKGIADIVVDALVQSGAVDVYEREQFEKIVAEQDVTNSSRFDPATAAKIGRNVGVQAVVIGSITKFGQHERKLAVVKSTEAAIAMTARVVDTSSGKILFTVKASGEEKKKGLSLDQGSLMSFARVPGMNATSRMGTIIPVTGAVLPMTEWIGKQFRGTLIGTVMSEAAEEAAAQILKQRDLIAMVPTMPSADVERAVGASPVASDVAPLTEQVLLDMLKNQVPEAQVIEIVNTHQNFSIAPLTPSWAIVVATNSVSLPVQNAVRARANLPPLAEPSRTRSK